MTSWIKGLSQIAFFVVFTWLMNRLTAFLHWNIPGSLLGITVFFLLLQAGFIKVEWIDHPDFPNTQEVSRGLLLGTAAHNAGTSKPFESGQAAGTISGIAMFLAAIVMFSTVPLLIPFFL